MPQQANRLFQLKMPVPSIERPIKLPPGGTHTQGIKFSTRGIGAQVGSSRVLRRQRVERVQRGGAAKMV